MVSVARLTIVTPHVGVWIETIAWSNVKSHLEVTPHVGVWIETLLILNLKT